MLFGGETNENTIEMITNICGILTSESNKETINNLLSSKLFRSLFTAILSGLNSDETSFIYLDDSIVEIDNNGARTITKEEINTVLYMIPDLLELAGPLLEGGDADVYGIVSDLLASDKMDKLFIKHYDETCTVYFDLEQYSNTGDLAVIMLTEMLS